MSDSNDKEDMVIQQKETQNKNKSQKFLFFKKFPKFFFIANGFVFYFAFFEFFRL